MPYTRHNQIRLRALYSDLEEVDDRQVQTQALFPHVKRLVEPIESCSEADVTFRTL